MHICKSTVVTTQNTVEKCINNFLKLEFLSDVKIKDQKYVPTFFEGI